MISILTIKESLNFFFFLSTIILFIIGIILWKTNQKLKKEIAKLETETKKLREKKVSKGSKEDLIPIKNISTEKKSLSTKKEPKKDSIPLKEESHSKSKDNYQNIKNEKYQAKPNNLQTIKPTSNSKDNASSNKNQNNAMVNSKNYQKNILEKRSKVTSPISINDTKETFDIDKLSLDLNEFIKKSKKVVPQIKETKVTKDYLKEISDQMAEELKPQTIELTSYEKNQEENAIISYQELLSVRDKITIEDDEENNVDFIDELKKFRNSLN